MEDKIKSDKSINIWEILKRSLFLYKENFRLFIGISLLGNALYTLQAILSPYTPTAPGAISSLIITFVCLFITLWADIALIIAASNRHLNNAVTIKECFVKTKGSYWRYIRAIILYYLILGLTFPPET